METCKKCQSSGHFKYSLGFFYVTYTDKQKKRKKIICVPDTITCLECGFSWEIE